MKTRLFLMQTVLAASLLSNGSANAWGPLGHARIGNAAVAKLDPPARTKVLEILDGNASDTLARAVAEACFWPDTVRDSPAWFWSAPMHYVNIPRSSNRYDRQRDCRDGLCAPEGIVKYAAELGRPGLSRERRWQSFAWLCHLVGDLHQPLHAGFRDDRGGNQVDIVYRGERSNLHEFWDSLLVNERLPGEDGGIAILEPAAESTPTVPWNPADVAAWTAESHALAAASAYPNGPLIGNDFADASWNIIQQQWSKAADRLAQVLNTIFAE